MHWWHPIFWPPYLRTQPPQFQTENFFVDGRWRAIIPSNPHEAAGVHNVWLFYVICQYCQKRWLCWVYLMMWLLKYGERFAKNCILNHHYAVASRIRTCIWKNLLLNKNFYILCMKVFVTSNRWWVSSVNFYLNKKY